MKKASLFIFAVLAMLASCKKEKTAETETEVGTGRKRVKQILFEDDGELMVSFNYNSDGNLDSWVLKYISSIDTLRYFKYNYSGGRLSYVSRPKTNISPESPTIFYSYSGDTTFVDVTDEFFGVSRHERRVCVYEKGALIREIKFYGEDGELHQTDSTEYIFEDGNLIEERTHNKSSFKGEYYVTKYTYDNKINPSEKFDVLFWEPGYLGPITKNNVIGYTWSRNSEAGLVLSREEEIIFYEYDSEDYPIWLGSVDEIYKLKYEEY